MMTIESHRIGEEPNNERYFELLVASVTDYAIYMLNVNGDVVSWNAGAQRFKGYLADEIIGQHFSTFYTDEDRAADVPANALQTALEHGRFEAEGWRVRKDRTQFWASVVIDPIHDASGRLVGFAKVTRDITERKIAQEALRESEERFRLLVQGVTDYAIFMLSPAGLVTNWNSGAARIKGYDSEEAVGMHFSAFYTDDDRAAGLPNQNLAIALRDGRFETEGWRVRKDGSRFWAHVVIDLIHNELGTPIGFAKIIRDNTDKKAAAEALERANATLFQAQKIEAIGQLTGGIAHDFNNLLAVMSSSLDILGPRMTQPDQIKIFGAMHRAVQRGATLTQQLLSFARQQPLSTEVQDLNVLINSFEAVLRRATNPSVSFHINLAANLRPVLVDAGRFEAALLNTVVNARDAMPAGGVLVIETSNIVLQESEIGSLPAGAYVRVTIRDSGEGMTPEVRARAFEPFFTTKEIGKGTGLGLSQVHGFIKQSGGEIILDSAIGTGTTVSIYLPASAQGIDAAGPQAAAVRGADTVLIVEDEPDLLEMASQLFQSIGYDVLTAANGKEAVEMLKRGAQIDILFSDVMMPNGMNGIELARYTRENFPQIKIVLASGYSVPTLRAGNEGIDDYTFMTKPYRLADLARTLRAAA